MEDKAGDDETGGNEHMEPISSPYHTQAPALRQKMLVHMTLRNSMSWNR